MFGIKLSTVIDVKAMMPMIARAVIVAVNFGVMMWLALRLGFDAFGSLAVLWGIALVVAPVVSLGGPLLLLRALTNGGGVSPTGLVLHMVTLPAAFAVIGLLVCPLVLPMLPWALIFFTAFAINILTSLASLMRALGSVNMSMALRDCGPQVSLALAALMTDQYLVFAVGWMVVFAGATFVWAWTRPARNSIVNDAHPIPGVSSSLWGTSVLGVGLSQVDIIVGGAILSPAQIGIYVVLRRVANLVALPVSVATWVSADVVSKTHASGDFSGLCAASKTGSRVALVPGIALFFMGIITLPFLPTGAPAIFAVLLSGAALQVVFASGFTVATLCSMANLAVISRGASLVVYIALTAFVAGPFENALAYVFAITCGSVLLWWTIWRRIGVDTSAFALGGRWKSS
jgi:O-antigen/teichoic acid export membrane protein